MGLTAWYGQKGLLLILSVGVYVGQTTATFGACSVMENLRGRGEPVGVSRRGKGVRAFAWLEAGFSLPENAFVGCSLLSVGFAAVNNDL
jgi:hypothetical protein